MASCTTTSIPMWFWSVCEMVFEAWRGKTAIWSFLVTRNRHENINKI